MTKQEFKTEIGNILFTSIILKNKKLKGVVLSKKINDLCDKLGLKD
jgi:hypothetical protein